jgi:uncharacterized membrane protein YgdD (TMEM256/DUF423 family)
MRATTWIVIGGVMGGLGVTAGAFGAHGLKGHPSFSPDDLATFEIAVRYQMYHALALALVGLLGMRENSRLLNAAGWCFLVGIVVFSGLLYVLVLTGVKLLGAIVPIGGVAMIVGWLALAVAAWRWRA